MREAVVGIGRKTWLQDGTRVEVTQIDGAEIADELDSTAEHEAFHVLAGFERGVGVIKATNVPGPGYGGYAQFTSFDSVVAAAPHAFGCDGTGHDLQQIEENGDSVSASLKVARALLSSKTRHMAAIATVIQNERVASGSQMKEAKEKVEEGSTVQVEVTSTDGKRTTKRVFGVKEDKLTIPVDYGTYG